ARRAAGATDGADPRRHRLSPRPAAWWCLMVSRFSLYDFIAVIVPGAFFLWAIGTFTENLRELERGPAFGRHHGDLGVGGHRIRHRAAAPGDQPAPLRGRAPMVVGRVPVGALASPRRLPLHRQVPA